MSMQGALQGDDLRADETSISQASSQLSVKLNIAADTLAAKQLSVDLEASAERLSALLREEEQWENTRNEALLLLQAEEESSGEEAGPFGSALTASLDTLQDEVQAMEERVSTLSRSHTDLAAKITKTKKNLFRAEEQEAELETLRPAWQDEYEMLEDELQELHQAYVSRVRNSHYLRKELRKMDRREARDAKRAEATRMELRKNILAEEAEVVEGEEEPQGSDSGGGDDGDSSIGASIAPTAAADVTTGGRPGTAATARLSIARSDSSSSISSVAGARSLSSNNSDADTDTDSDSAW
mmetsp:Transcript_29510/g.85925  ORF Transcript_29510/g.85925 Transcript_29510/m.85925 type:complete len:298 (+) Transcript_29510:735-1628(+)